MSSKDLLPRSLCVFALGALVLVSIILFPVPGRAQTANTAGDDRGVLPADATGTPASDAGESRSEATAEDKPSSALWRSFIWDSLPPETLGGPGPDPVSEAYQKNDWRPIFIDATFGLNQGAAELLGQLQNLESEAIDSKPFKLTELSQSIDRLNKSRSELRNTDPDIKDTRADSLLNNPSSPASATVVKTAGTTDSVTNRADLREKYEETFRAASAADIRLTTAFLLFARQMNPLLGEEDYLKAISGEVPMSVFLKDLEPKTFHYEALVTAYRKYGELAANVNQQHVSIPDKVQRGESGSYVRDLQKRLHQEGFYSGSFNGVFDSETERAVKEFQSAHNIDPDGAVGKQTAQWLNVSFRHKADMIAAALKAIRQSPSRANARFIRINIPQFVLEYYKDGQMQERHRIVVGKAIGKKVKFRGKMVGENQTPTLSSAISQIIINPRWYVSDRIRLELNAEAKSDPEWFAKHGYVSMQSQHPWGEHRLFQSPGPKNALGRVKFEFPNPYAVYLHDTPMKHLFGRSRRDFSHGCIRVDKAIVLAERLLTDDGSPYAAKMEKILSGSNQVYVKLSQPVPISIEYIPVVADDKAQVVFAGDPYGLLDEDQSQKG